VSAFKILESCSTWQLSNPVSRLLAKPVWRHDISVVVFVRSRYNLRIRRRVSLQTIMFYTIHPLSWDSKAKAKKEEAYTNKLKIISTSLSKSVSLHTTSHNPTISFIQQTIHLLVVLSYVSRSLLCHFECKLYLVQQFPLGTLQMCLCVPRPHICPPTTATQI
jgi:hypothetical protein